MKKISLAILFLGALTLSACGGGGNDASSGASGSGSTVSTTSGITTSGDASTTGGASTSKPSGSSSTPIGHLHNYDEYGLCENCPLGESVGYRGTTIMNQTDSVVTGSGQKYYECRVFYNAQTAKFLDTHVRKGSDVANLKVAVRRDNAWDVLYNGPANNNGFLKDLGSIQGSFVYLRYSWNFDGEPDAESNYLRVSDLAAHQYYDVNDRYCGYILDVLGEMDAEQIQSNYVLDFGNYKQVYFGWDIVTKGQCYKPLAIGFGVNPQISAYQMNPSTHTPIGLAKNADGSFEAIYNDVIAFVLTTDIAEDITGQDEYKIGVAYLRDHTMDEKGFCKVCHEYLGKQDVVMNSQFAVYAPFGDFYFRIPIIGAQHYYFCLDSNNLQGLDSVNAWIKDGNNFDSYDIFDSFTDEYHLNNHEYPEMVIFDEADIGDGYLYINLHTDDNSGLDFNLTAYDEHLIMFTGECVGHDVYVGQECEVGEGYPIGEMEDGHFHLPAHEKEYVRFYCAPSHEYQVTFNNVLGNEVEFYYQNIDTGEWIILERTAGKFITPMDSVFQNWVYTIIDPELELIDASFLLKCTEHNGDIDDYGFCNDCGLYTGTELEKGVASAPFTLGPGEYAYFRYIVTTSEKNLEVEWDYDHMGESGYQINTNIDQLYESDYSECQHDDGMNDHSDWSTATGTSFQQDAEIYIVIHNQWTFTMTNLVITVSEF